MRGPRIPRVLRFKNYLNNHAARLRNSLIDVDLPSPGYLGLKIIYVIVPHVYVTSLICVVVSSPGYLGLKIIYIIVPHICVTPLYNKTMREL